MFTIVIMVLLISLSEERLKNSNLKMMLIFDGIKPERSFSLYFLVITKPLFSLFQVHVELPAEKLLDKPVLMSSFSAWISTFDFASSVPCFVSVPVRCGV